MAQVEPTLTPTLRTERLVLRAPEASDAPLIALYAGDARVAKNLARVPHPYPPGAAEAFIRTARKAPLVWAIEYNDELIGVIGLEPKDGHHFLGYWLAPQLWGGGFMAEAVGAVIAHAKAEGFNELHAQVSKDNAPSARVLEKCGFKRSGSSEIHSVARGGNVASWEYTLTL